MVMHDDHGVSFHSSNNQDALMPSTDTPLQKWKKKEKAAHPDCTTSDHNDIGERPPKPFYRLVEDGHSAAVWRRAKTNGHGNWWRCDGPAETWWWSWHPWKADWSDCLHAQLHHRREKPTVLCCVRVASLRLFLFLIPQGLTVGVLCYDDPALCDWL